MQPEKITIPVGTPLADAEKALILATLAHHDGDKPRTAETLGVSLKTIYNKLHRYGEMGS